MIVVAVDTALVFEHLLALERQHSFVLDALGLVEAHEIDELTRGLSIAVALFNDTDQDVERHVLNALGHQNDVLDIRRVLEVLRAVLPDDIFRQSSVLEVVVHPSRPIEQPGADTPLVIAGQQEQLPADAGAIQQAQQTNLLVLVDLVQFVDHNNALGVDAADVIAEADIDLVDAHDDYRISLRQQSSGHELCKQGLAAALQT